MSKPQFKTVDPSTGQAGKVYEGHTVDEARAIAARTQEGLQRLAASTVCRSARH